MPFTRNGEIWSGSAYCLRMIAKVEVEVRYAVLIASAQGIMAGNERRKPAGGQFIFGLWRL